MSFWSCVFQELANSANPALALPSFPPDRLPAFPPPLLIGGREEPVPAPASAPTLDRFGSDACSAESPGMAKTFPQCLHFTADA